MFYPTVSMLYTDEQEMLAGAQTIHELGRKDNFLWPWEAKTEWKLEVKKIEYKEFET